MDRPWNFAAASRHRKGALELAQRVAPAHCTVLITGPTGVGKDVLAEDIHSHSPRARRRFVALNCAALPAALFESELFGHGRGAYTSANGAKAGLVELADGGTLFLDEVGELPLEAQAKLLRFLSKGTFWPVGGTEERSADVRVIAATNRDLRGMLGGGFREDLFFRLSVITIALRALDPADARLLARALAEELAGRQGLRLPGRELDAIADLAAGHSLRGGVRELRNVLERFFVLRDPGRPVEEGFWAAAALDAPVSGAELAAATPIAMAPAAAAHDGSPAEAMRHLDDLMFLLAARSAASIRELAGRLDRSLQTIYERLRRLGLRPQQVGHPELDQAIGRTRAALAAHRPWIQELLKGVLEG